MKLTNREVKDLQKRLDDIIQNITVNMEMMESKDIPIYFLEPILRVAVDISDKVFIQTKDTENEIKL